MANDWENPLVLSRNRLDARTSGYPENSSVSLNGDWDFSLSMNVSLVPDGFYRTDYQMDPENWKPLDVTFSFFFSSFFFLFFSFFSKQSKTKNK